MVGSMKGHDPWLGERNGMLHGWGMKGMLHGWG